MYQVLHPWHWLTYGRNATAFGIVLAALLNLVTIIVLYGTWRAVNRQAKAANKQATAAESATEVSNALRIAAEDGARAQREHSELVKQQLLASLRPIVVVGRQPHPLQPETPQYFAANQGEGVAMEVICHYRDTPTDHIPLVQNIIGGSTKSVFSLNTQHAQNAGLELSYKSQDGRFFVTKVTVGPGGDFVNEASEVDVFGQPKPF